MVVAYLPGSGCAWRGLLGLSQHSSLPLRIARGSFRSDPEATTISRRGFDWLLGFAGTFAPLLVIPAERAPVVPIALFARRLLGPMRLALVNNDLPIIW